MTYRITSALAATACAVSLLAGVPAMAQGKIEAKISSTAGPDSINTFEMNMMAKLVDLYTNGSVDGKVFTLAQLGKERAQLEGLVLGTHDVFVHISAVQRANLAGLDEGQKVSYEVVQERGKSSAGNLKTL